jgi:hypothetical protein
MAYNEVGVTRLQYLSDKKTSPLPSSSNSSSPSITAAASASGSRSMGDRLLSLLGVQQVTDEQYLAKLKATRDSHLKRIAELEKQIAEDPKKDDSPKD